MNVNLKAIPGIGKVKFQEVQKFKMGLQRYV